MSENEKENSSEQKQCPECGKNNAKDAIMCEECGAPLGKTTSSKTLDETTESYKICPSCENQCGVDDTFCNKCGQKLVFETKCPNCGEDFSDDDLFCKKCGTKLPQRPQKISITKFYCPICGTEYNEVDIFCAECGTNLKTNEVFSVKPQSSLSDAPANNSSNIQTINQSNNYSNQSSCNEQYKNDNCNDFDTVKCPYCNSNVKRYTKKCPHCGEWLSGVSHFGCGSFLVLITTIIAICMAAGGESIGIPLVGEIGGIWLVVTAFLYFLPSLISDWRGHDSKLAIFIVNLLFGWTLIGWFAALIFSFTGRSR